MTPGLSEQLPDVSAILSSSNGLQGGIQGLLSSLGSIDPKNPSSPINGVQTKFGGLSTAANVDLSSLTQKLPAAINSLQNALPDNTLSSLTSFSGAYQLVRDLMGNSALAQQVVEGKSLQDVALAVIADARQLFDQRLSSLTGGLISADSLGALTSFFTDVDHFKTDFASHKADFLPFVSRNLLGVNSDVLSSPLSHLDQAFSVLAPLDESALAASLGPARQAIAGAYTNLVHTLQAFDPADANAYVQIQAQLDALDAADRLILTALNSFYQALDTLIANHNWDAIFQGYVSLLEAINVGDVFTVDDLVATLANLLEELLSKMLTAFSADDLRQRLDLLNQTIHDAVLSSPLGQIRTTLQSFLDDIRQQIAAIPTQAIQEAVDGVLGRIQQELDDLNIGQVKAQITQAFQQLETFINDNINTGLGTNVQGALAPLVEQVNELPLADLINQLSGAVASLQGVIDNLTAALNSEIDNLNNLLSQLEGLSFKPISDEVIGEIDDLKTRLEAINPDSLSDVEKLAIQAALAVLRSIDLEGKVIGGLKEGYHAAEGEIKSLLDQLNTALEGLSGRFNLFSPDALLGPVNQLLDQASNLVSQLNGQTLFAPLYQLVDQLVGKLQALDPGKILDPLQGPYDQMMAVFNRLDPAQWVKPLEDLYQEIDHLIDLVDITPLLDELDNLQKGLFASIRQGLLDAIDHLSLPEPLGSFFNQMKPVFELMTDALFGDPSTQLRQLSLKINDQVKLTSLFAPLDTVFLELVTMLETVPHDELTAAMEAIRQSVGIALDVLNPQNILSRFRAGYGQLSALSPTNLLSASLNLPALKVSFTARASAAPSARQGDVAAVSARFDLAINTISPSATGGQIQQLVQSHTQLLHDLRLRITALDSSSASQNYTQLRNNLNKLLPDFLRQAQPLTFNDIHTGLYAMRPSTKAAAFENVLDRFIQRVNPLMAALEPGVNNLFSTLHDLISLINPLSVKDSVKAIYDEIHAKIRVIDPADLKTRLQNLLNTVLAPLQAINPASIKAEIDGVFQSALAALSTQVKAILDQLVGVINTAIRSIKAAIQALIDQIKAAITAILHDLQAVLDRVKQLVFVDILERLNRVIDNLGLSFNAELDRVRNAFDDMLNAIPLGSGASASVSV